MPVVVDHSGYFENEDYNPPKKLESDLLLSLELPYVTIKMPRSRITRSRYSSSPPKRSWPKLIAQTYNENSVGSFAGNFDKPINTNIRCGNTILSFHEFCEFQHDPETECHAYKVNINRYFELDDVSKIKSLELDDSNSLKIAGPASMKGSKYELNTILYTCVHHGCIIPCPCYLCIDEDPDECDHKILHPGFFDPSLHLFTVRNADSYDINWNEERLQYCNEYCTNRKCRGIRLKCRTPPSFNYRQSCIDLEGHSCCCSDCPYCKSVDVIKHAGIEKSCASCKMKLLHHESYHLIYHYMCLFCRESLHKFKNITSEKEYWDEFEETRFQEESSCHFCLKLFFDDQKKKRHIEIVHNKNPDFLLTCRNCELSFGSKLALVYHQETYHDHIDLKLPCQICEKTFKTNHNLDVHMKSVHRETEYPCDLCFSSFTRQSNLNHHYKICHDTVINKLFLNDDPSIFEYFECNECLKGFREKRTLNHHMKVVHLKHEQPVLNCEDCDFETIELKTLNHHIKMVHERSKLPLLACDECKFRTTEAKTLTHHKKTVHTKNNALVFKCNHCEFKTKYKYNLKMHQNRKHGLSDKKKKPLTCNQCEFRTIDEDLFAEHASKKHIQCEKCRFRTIYSNIMGIHQRAAHKTN